ncbi:MAG: TonB-dependent receptor [Dysgonamonadaceae bacterium]|jgi:outer membrane receptor protein involved in Fe transport|nr:TonB-dependent receptor [Dysgonamonadaceae bacterium]
MKRTLALTIFIFTLSMAFPVYSQTLPVAAGKTAGPRVSITLKGQVIDSLSRESMPYVTLKITESGNPSKVVKLLSTDDSGKFNVILNTTGKFDLLVNTVGKTPLIKPFEITGTEKTVDLSELPLSDSQSLGEVVVTAIKPLVSVDLDKITYSMQDDPDSKTSNVLDMMRKVPMVTVDAEDNIQLKGSSSFKIYMDGKPSNLISSNPTQVLRSMPASMIKNVEVITDPGAKYDAEGVTGIINIITNKQPMGGYTANLGAGVDTRGGYNGSAYGTLKYGKLGFTGNYSYLHFNNPKSDYDSYRETYNPLNEKYLFQNGQNKYEGNYQFGSGELSYDIDTLNLITASFNRYGGSGESKGDVHVKALMPDKNTVAYSYDQESKNKNEYGSTSVNVDYQRTFKKKDELLTASYRYNLSPNDSESDTKIENPVNYYGYWLWQKTVNDASDKEHTFQVDYTTPIAKLHTIEAGIKYIIRLNNSDTDRDTLGIFTNRWGAMETPMSEFKYRYDIIAGYLGYNLKYKNYGFKAGLRMEDTKTKAEYPLESPMNFDNHYNTLVPSATVTYRFKMVHNIRLGYNMRVQRPGISLLNPYINDADPKYVSSGNPNLDVEKAHNIGLTYGVFKPKFNLNVGLNYNFVNNAIQRISRMEGDVTHSTYENLGKQQRTGLNVYWGWNPINNLRLNINASGNYLDIDANDGSGRKSHGFTGNLFGNAQYTLPKDFRLSFYGGGSSPSVNFQGENDGFYFYGLGINRSFLNKKLTLSLSSISLFNKYRDFTSKTNKNSDYYQESHNRVQMQNFNFRVSYQFGEMKQQAVKKVRRSITNDDVKAGETNSGASGEQQGGAQGGGN